MALLGQAEGMLMLEQMPILPIYYYVNITGYRPHLKGVYPNPRDRYLFKHIYIEENNQLTMKVQETEVKLIKVT